MKTRAFLAFIAMLLMLALAFGIGAYRGLYAEKVQVELALSSLSDVLAARVEMGYNLLTVAGRHLREDDQMLFAVREEIAVLEGTGSLTAMAQANAQLAKDSKQLLTHLAQQASVKDDARDFSYVTSLLPRGFEQSAQWADATKYNAAARAYNSRLNGTFTGQVASALGVEPAFLFEGGTP